MIENRKFEMITSSELFDTCMNASEVTYAVNNEFGLTFEIYDEDTICFEVDGKYVNSDMWCYIVECYKFFASVFDNNEMYHFN